MIPQDFIQELLARTDVVEVVGRYVQLKKGGINFMGLCPFHNEKSPSFTVSQSKQFYHCFGCGVHGTAISFLMEHLGMGFIEAVKQLANDVGMTVPEEKRELTAQQLALEKQTPSLLQSLEKAAVFYKSRLKDDERAKKYLIARGLSGQTAKHFGLGYAPDSWRALEACFGEYGAEELVSSGLVIEADAQKRYDRFRDRIMFPIRNPKGQVIGFGGRVLDKGEPKYLNSPETPVFSKGRELYGLFEGRDAIRQKNTALVVEGYMDVVMLAQHGIGHAVATLGTATTPQHIQKLTRIVDRVVFAFDGDSAGRRAARRALETCLPLVNDEKRFEFLFLPQEHDPDSYVRENGQAAFESFVDQALSFSEFFIQVLRAESNLDQPSADTPENRALFQAHARPLLQLMPLVTALRAQLMRRVAGVAGVEVNQLEAYLDAKPHPTARFASAGQNSNTQSDSRELVGEADPSYSNDVPSGYMDPHSRRHNQWGSQRQGRNEKTWGKAKNRGALNSDRDGTESARLVRRLPPTSLESRARLLAALFPQLARNWLVEQSDSSHSDADWLPLDLVRWFEWVSEQNITVNFAGLCQALEQTEPTLALRLSEEAQSEFSDLELGEAIFEFQGALHALKRKKVSQKMAELAQDGLQTEQAKREYQGLMRLERELAQLRPSAPPETPKK
jgi:DNA primase